MALSEQIARLVLPKRFEVLAREAEAQSADLGQIVYRVEPAARRVEQLLRAVRDGGVGRFEFFLGASGSGKTTFLKTLPRFFDGVSIGEMQGNVPLHAIPEELRSRRLPDGKSALWILHGRDNPQIDIEQARRFFEDLRVLYREPAGQILVVWPITDATAARTLSEIAWDIGRDSLVDLTKGLYEFHGLGKEFYYDVGDTTARSLSGGRSLEAFGLTRQSSDDLVRDSSTISEFYTRLEQRSAEINQTYQDILKDRPIPRIWILVAADDSRAIDLTVATLTQGTERRIDIDRLCEFLDNPNLDAAYLKPWKARRDQLAYLMRLLDVRLFELPPSYSLPVIRAFGDADLRSTLKLQATKESVALDTLENARFFRHLLGDDPGRTAISRATADEAQNEYLRAQQNASKDDKPLNRALAAAISEGLARRGIKSTVICESRSGDGNLQPDISVQIEGQSPICLEPTWRTTGKAVSDEIKEKQSSLSIGHIQMYLLDKVMTYVEDLGLGR